MNESADDTSPTQDEAIAAFWEIAKHQANLVSIPGYFGPTPVESVPPPAWSFGATPEHAEELLQLVLDGTKTATASALWDYGSGAELLPQPGTLGIVLDGDDRPRALLMTTDVHVVPFDQVGDEHARLEGEGDLSLAHWREAHERFFSEHATHDRGFTLDMPVVLERFEVIYQD